MSQEIDAARVQAELDLIEKISNYHIAALNLQTCECGGKYMFMDFDIKYDKNCKIINIFKVPFLIVAKCEECGNSETFEMLLEKEAILEIAQDMTFKGFEKIAGRKPQGIEIPIVKSQGQRVYEAWTK